MKQRSISIIVALAALWSVGSAGLQAQDAVDFRAGLRPESTVKGATVFRTLKDSPVTYGEGEVRMPATGKETRQDSGREVQPKDVPAEFGGIYIMTVKSLRPDLYGDTGSSVTVTPIAGTDSVWLYNFWENGINLKAAVNLQAGTVSIPNQVIGVNSNGVTVDFASCDAIGKPVRNKKVEGVINADGTISVTTWWGMFAVDGPDKDRYAYVGGDTEFERSNGTMSFSFQDGTKVSFGVVISQPYDNQVLVKNFANYGMTVKIWLDSSRGGSIPTQIARQYPANKANFMTMSVGSYSTSGNPSGMTNTIPLIPTGEGADKALRWGKWSAFSMGTTNMFFGAILDGKLEYEGNFRYPAPVSGSFEGSGTETDPWLIKSVTDFVRLADEVNHATTATPDTIGGFVSVLSYTGKYFKLANDIDLSSRLLTPIGADLNHHFNGTFDGAGHTLTGLSQETGGAGLAGLFGMCGPQSVIRNVTIKDANISAEGLIASVLAGWSYGTVSDCRSTGAKVSNTQRIASGLVGAAETITGCSVDNATIDGRGGNAAGLCGQVNVSIENCSVTNTNIIAGSASDGYPAGGVVASMNHAKGKNLCFSGSIDSRVLMNTLTIGGICGILSDGSLESSYAIGTIASGVSTTGRNAVAGGVAGTVYGSEMSDCYFIGVAGTYYSRMAGGITGWVRTYTNAEGTISQSTVRNCYTASVITSETYLYDSAKEVREALGWVDEGTTPTLENIYFDNQYTNLNTKQYGVPGSFLTSAAGPTGFPKDKWVFTEGQYPRLKGLSESQTALMSASSILMAPQSSMKKLSANATLRPLGDTKFSLILNGKYSDKGHYCSIEKDVLVISSDFGVDTLAMINGAMEVRYELKVAPVPFSGEGTEQNPYLISTKEDMIALGNITSVVKQYFPQTYFLMTNDIDMEHDPAFKGICIDTDAYCKFGGYFDGGGHTIDNVLEEWVVWTQKPENDDDLTGVVNTSDKGTQNNKGIFGRLAEGAVIRNLNVGAGCDFRFWARSGAIVGQNEGIVENCRNYARVRTISSIAGGIVGENRKGTVRGCYNGAEVVSGYNGAGGIIGTGNGIVEQCVNTGDVYVKQLSTFQKPSASMTKGGGIQGENTGTNFFDCINYGSVNVYHSQAGGIVSMLAKITSTTVTGNNSMERTINLGGVKVEVNPALTGAIGGTSGTEGTIAGVYWDKQLIPLKAQGGMPLQGAEGLSTAQLVSGEALPGYDASIWSFEKGMYPTLKQFADEPKVKEARAMIVMLPEGTDIDNLTEGATLDDRNAVWSLQKGTAFKIEGNKLISPADVKEMVTDMLTVKSGSFGKMLSIACPPTVPLAGTGKETDPYIIATADDWNTLAEYASSAHQSFEGKYLKVSADIDFTGKTFKSLFGDGVTNFSGTLDGTSHTVKGIKMTTTSTYQAAIGTITAEATVRNLTLSGDITSDQQYTGGFAAKVYGTLENCVNGVNVTSTKAAVAGFGYIYEGAVLTDVSNIATISGGAGSVAGIASYTTEGVTFTRVVNKGIIKGTATGTSAYTGGLVAQCAPATFISCSNEGTFEFTNPTGANSVGGLVAYANAATGHKYTYAFKDCHNYAAISANNVLGGIVANSTAGAANINPINMSGCVNHAPITSVATKATTSSPTCGIIALYTPGSTIENCINEGVITSPFNVYAAGIAGYLKTSGTITAPTLLKGCVNKGDIDAKGNQGAGIMAATTNYVTIDSCINTGNISGGFGLGGLVAQLAGNEVELSRSWNSGDVTTSTNRTGGLIGWNTVVCNVHDCFNTGNVSTTCETAGVSTTTAAPSGFAIGGLAGYSASEFRRCYNTGDVKGASRVGGLVGQPYKDRTVIDSCYNAGKIIAPADTCGNIIGINLNNGKEWNTKNVVTNTYYIKGSSELLDASVGTALTDAGLAEIDLGTGWNSGDIYTWPMLVGMEPAQAKVVAARVICGDKDGGNMVKGLFHVGCPEGVEWSCDNSVLTFSGNDAVFKDAFKGNLTLTVACEGFTRNTTITADVASGLDDLEMGKDYTDTYFTPDGMSVTSDHLDRGVYVRVRTYSDGRRESLTIVR